MVIRTTTGLCCFLLAMCIFGLAVSQPPDSEPVPTTEQLKKQLKELELLILRLEQGAAEESEADRKRLRESILELKRQLEELQEELTTGKDQDLEAEIESLRDEANRATAGDEVKEEETEAQRQTAGGRQRSQQAFNPEISVLGDFSYDATDSDVPNQFVVRDVEFSFAGALDPYTRFRTFLGAGQEPEELMDPNAPPGGEEEGEISVFLEEAYVEWVALPLTTRIRVGQFRQQFGVLNRWHRHALPSTDTPIALRNIFGGEGLVGLGFHADWQLPSFWSTTASLALEVVNPENENAFAGDFDNPEFLLRLASFYDLGQPGYFEFGLNGVTGPNDDQGHDTSIFSLDFNFVWEPPGRARYRGWELRGEYFYTDFETNMDTTVNSNSIYTYLMWKASRSWVVGLRYDNAELPWDRFDLHGGQTFQEGLREEAWTPIVTFWQSEYVRLRFQYQHATRDFDFAQGAREENRFWIQVTFAAGPHKHEAY